MNAMHEEKIRLEANTLADMVDDKAAIMRAVDASRMIMFILARMERRLDDLALRAAIEARGEVNGS